MRRPNWLSVLSLSMFGLVASGHLAGCSSSKTCTLLGCESSATMRVYAAVDRTAMTTATITACRNGSCSAGQPTTVPSAPGDRLAFRLAGPIAAEGYLSSPDPVKGYKIEAVFALEGVTTANGDTYEIRVTPAGAAAPAVTVSDKATYQSTQPNGPDCPPECTAATIDKTL
ncbi:MAG: hypothetical protein U0235_17480 [Polyangiaceae bacterium]